MSENEKTQATAVARVLIVDDEEGMRNYLSVVLKKAGVETVEAVDGLDACERLAKERFDVVLEDLKMPRLDGLGLLRRIRDEHPHVAVVIMTAYSTWETAVEAMRLGAFNYIRKPFDNEEIRNIVKRAAETSQALRARRDDDEPFVYRQIIGNSPGIRAVQDLVRRVAPTDSTVCIQGESGTGKELVARAIHHLSTRRHGPFIAVNCSAFTESLLESELFGHVRGAFTGAVVDKRGLFEAANGGTLFLDEIAEIARPVQTKLLRALEEREVKPVGSVDTVRIDVRVVAATNRTLADEVSRGNFREDLFYRLNVISVTLPPLRERKGDIPFLVGHFMGKYATIMNKHVTGITREAIDTLFAHDWPGNIRELENTLQRAVALAPGPEISPAEIIDRSALSPRPTVIERQVPASREDETAIPPGGLRLEDHLEDIEKSIIIEALRRTDQVVTRAADLLHIDVRALRYRIKKLDLREEMKVAREEPQNPS